MIHTTLNLLKENDACIDGYKTLLRHLGLDFDKAKEIPLVTILESNDLSDILWVLDNAPLEEKDANILGLYFGAWCAKQVLPLYEKEYPDDNRVRNCIDTTMAFADGKATQEELAAARAAARAARDVARPNVWEAARSAQTKQLKEMLEE